MLLCKIRPMIAYALGFVSYLTTYIRAFTLDYSNRIYIKKIATNSLNTPHQPRQITITQKLLYSSSPKWSSYCSLASLILPFKYSFFLSPSFCLAHSLPQLHAKRFGPQTVPISPTKERPIDLSPLRSI